MGSSGYVRLVGQELAPSKCVLLRTSRAVRKDLKDWVPSQEGDKWSDKFDVSDPGGHLDTTFRGWSAILAFGFGWSLLGWFLSLLSPLTSMVGYG